MKKLNIIHLLRGIGELAIAVYLIGNWASAPKLIVWFIIIGTLLQGLNSILESRKGA